MLSQSEIRNNRELVLKIDQIKNFKKNSFNKIIYDSINDFSVDTNKVMQIENETFHSYTLPVIKTNTSTLENIVIMVYPSGEIKTFLINYNKTYTELINMSIEQIQANQVGYSLIDFEAGIIINSENNTNKIDIMCVEHYSWDESVPCHEGDLTGGDLFCGGWVLESSECYNVSGGTGGGTSSSDGDNTSSNTNNTDTSNGGLSYSTTTGGVVTTPIGYFEDEESEAENNPCNDLNNLSNNVKIQQGLSYLKAKTEDTKEHAVTYARGSDGNVQTLVTSSTSQSETANVSYGPTIFGTSHTHWNGIYPMLMPGDLASICKFVENYQQPTTGSEVDFDNLFFNIMVAESSTATDISDSPNGYAYIVFPNDIDAFVNSGICDVLSNPNKLKRENIKMEYDFAGDNNYIPRQWNEISQTEMAKILLEYLKTKIGSNVMSLYRKKFDTNKNLTGNWEELKLDATQSNGIKKTPCN